VTPQEGLPADLAPPWYGDNLLRALHRLSLSLPLEAAIPRLRQAVADRLGTPHTLKHAHLLPADVEKVRKSATLPASTPRAPPPQEKEAVAQPVAAVATARTPNAHQDPLKENTTGPPPVVDVPDSQEESGEGGGDGEGSSSSGSSSPSLSPPPPSPPSPPSPAAPDAEAPGSSPRRPQRPQGARVVLRLGEPPVVATSPEPLAGCRCLQRLGEPQHWPDSTKDAKAAAQWLHRQLRPEGLAQLCRIHLRQLAGGLGMKNNLTTARLVERLQVVRQDRNQTMALRRRHPDWFRKPMRPALASTQLLLYRFEARPLSPDPPGLDADQLLQRFAGPDAPSSWAQTGNLLVRGALDYLDYPEIRAHIDSEFAMYRHHERTDPDLPRQGWMRHMYHSLIQQLTRQDPVWYALTVATRPDHQWRLISYPYLAKETRPAEKTGFLHLDINVAEYLRAGQGANLISSGLALDDEDEHGCTVIVPGFHHHIAAWHERVRARGQESGAAATNCMSSYTAEDRERWGGPQPVPCRAFDVRLTHPAVMHGSTGLSTQPRRSLFGWMLGVDAAHDRLDVPRTPSWGQVAADHRDGGIPRVQPNGLSLRHAVPDGGFPATVLLRGISPLADALVGARRWTDPEVMRERDILLGDDDEKAWALVHEIRQRLVEGYLREMGHLRELEARLYGPNAFFQSGTTTEPRSESPRESSGTEEDKDGEEETSEGEEGDQMDQGLEGDGDAAMEGA
jgi:hypothetical protein